MLCVFQFECIVPRLRPVSVVEKRVEVPVVKTVDTIVPRPRVEERIKFVDKPIFQEVEKFVEVPEVFFNDVIVEVSRGNSFYCLEMAWRLITEPAEEYLTWVCIIPVFVDVSASMACRECVLLLPRCCSLSIYRSL